MRMNGRQRLWLLASILWAVVVLALAGILQFDGDQAVPSANEALLVVGCGSCRSRRFMGLALASLGSAADFKSSQSSLLLCALALACGSAPPSVRRPRCWRATTARHCLSPPDRTTMPNASRGDCVSLQRR